MGAWDELGSEEAGKSVRGQASTVFFFPD